MSYIKANPKLSDLRKAAPEMYEALKMTLIDWQGTCKEYGVPQEDMRAVEDVINKALAKAESK